MASDRIQPSDDLADLSLHVPGARSNDCRSGQTHKEVVMSKLGALASFIPVLLMANCTVESFTEGEATQAESAVNTVGLSELADSALNTARLDAANAAVMGSTASRRKILATAVSCALGSTQTIMFSVGGVAYSNTGGLGIAPSWTTGALTATQASWVSACVFAHVNDATKLIWLSVRGSDASLMPSLSERTDYQVEEGAFWGNAFLDRGAVAAYSCTGVDQALDDSYGDLPLRPCAQWDGVASSNKSSCGMIYAGPCSSACSTQAAPYAGCSFQGSAAAGPVVTIFLSGAHPQ
jgi:hypothetical protein